MEEVVRFLTNLDFGKLGGLEASVWIRDSLSQKSTRYDGKLISPLNGEPPAILTSEGKIELKKTLTHIRYLPKEELGKPFNKRIRYLIEY